MRTGPWLAALLLGAACASTQRPGPPGTPLRGAVQAVEITEDGRSIPIPDEGITEVDVNSTIALAMNPAVFASEATKVVGGAALRGPSLDLVAPLGAMDDVTRAEQASAGELQHLVDGLAAGHPPSDAELRHLGELQFKVTEAVDKYCEIARIDKATRSSLFSGPRYTMLEPWINRERSRLLALVQQRVEQLPNLRLRMEASSSRAGAIHLPNYDDLPEGASTLVNKVALRLDDQTMQNFKAAQALSTDLNLLIDQKGSIRQKIEQVMGDNLRQAQAAWEEWAKQDLAKVEALVAKLKKTLAADPDAKVIVADAGGIAQEGQAVRGACTPAVTSIQAILDGGFAGADFGPVMKCANAVKDAFPKLKDRLPDAARAAESLMARARKDAGGAALAAVKEQGEGLQTVVHAKEAMDRLQSTWTAVASALNLQQGPATPTWRTDHFQDRELGAVVDTVLDIPRIDRKDGDQISFRPAIVRDGKPALVGTYKALRVFREGARVDVGAALTFVHPTSLRDGEDAFRAAPAVSAALHYRNWRCPGKNAGNRVWNFFDPGIGLNVLYPDLGHTTLDAGGKVVSKDPSSEIGLGGVVQLFGDLMQAGYGYDIQVGRGYWFLGFGLQRLADLGISFPRTEPRVPAAP